MRRQDPRHLSASVSFSAQRLPPNAGRGMGGIQTRLGAGAQRAAGAALGLLNSVGSEWGRGAQP